MAETRAIKGYEMLANGQRARLLIGIALAAAVALLAALIGLLIQRPLWFDETMAMTNYPATSLRALVAPLPYYSQAAPALFNIICSAIVALPPAIGRGALFLLVAGGLSAVTYATYRRWWALAVVVVFCLGSFSLVYYATAFKYYGVEILGTGVIIAWFLGKRDGRPLQARDAAVLILGMLCGISTLVIAVIALSLHLLPTFRARQTPSTSEWLVILAVLFVAALSYLAVRFATSIQLANFPDVYAHRGLSRAVKYVGSIRRLLSDTTLPLVAVGIVAALLDRSRFSVRLLMLAATAALVFGVLCVAGLYPATTDRHVAWADGFAIFLFANAVAALTQPCDAEIRGWRRPLAIALILAVLLAGAPNLQRLARRDTGALEDNDKLVAWLLQQPPHTIAMWIGTQPMVQYYRRFHPVLDKHRYLGWRDPSSLPVPRAFVDPRFLAQPYAAIGQVVEAHRDDQGSYNHDLVYRIRNDYRAPARTLIAQARQAGPFYVVASHLDYDATFTESLVIRDALLLALRENHCTSRMVLKVKGGFVLQVRCPNSPDRLPA